MSTTVDDVLSLLDEMNEQGRIEYADYSQLHDAIAATLGGSTLTAHDVWEAIGNHGVSQLQAIADELNAELGGGNCARCAEDMGRYADSLCDPLKERIAELLRCLENDWHIHASWDGLRKFWCIELTEEGVKLRDAAHVTLTAEQVRETVEKHWHDLPADYDMPEATALPEYSYDWQAIADELNAAMGGGECEFVIEDNMNESEGMGDVWFRCTNCDTKFDYYADDWLMKQNYCPHCGFKIRKAVKR